MTVNNLTKRAKKRGNPVKALMVEKGVLQAEIAEECKVSAAIVSGVVSGKKKSRRIREMIAKRLDRKVSDLWPENNGKRAA